MIEVTLDSRLRIPKHLPPDNERAIDTALEAAVAYRNPVRGDTRFFPEWLSTLSRDHSRDEWTLPRAALQMTAVRNVLGPRIVVKDNRFTRMPVKFPRGMELLTSLRSYQAAPALRCLEEQQGIIIAPTASGKTRTMLAAIALLEQPTLVIEPTLDLVEQTRAAVLEAFGPDGPHYVKVLTPQSALAQVAELALRIGCVMVDEAHHAVSPTIRALLDLMPARYRFGWTATPKRSDGLEVLLEQYFGPVIHTVGMEEATDAGAVLVPRLERVPTNFSFAYRDRSDWPKLLDALVEDLDRNALIASRVAKEVERNEASALVLTGRVQHAYELAKNLAFFNLRVEVLVGDMPKKQRTAILERARIAAVDVVVATQLADEGLDIPRLNVVALTFPGRSERQLLQRIGRVLRPHEAKGEPLVLDFVDEKVGPLVWQASKRRAAFNRTWPSNAKGRAA